MKKRTEKIALFGMMTAAAFVLSWIESFLPVFFGVPGIKPGLSNIVTLVSLYVLGIPAAVAITLVRVLLSGFTFGSLYSVIYALSGAVFSLCMEIILKKTGKAGTIGVSVTGGVFHNAGQIAAAVIILGDAVMYYFPFLVVSGVAAGILTGFISGLVINRIPKSFRGL